jgi:spore coat protein U-like protein
MRSALAVLGGFALLAVVAGPAGAASDHAAGDFDVTATVTASCSASVADLAFGAYDPAVAGTGATTLSVTCTDGTLFRVGANEGLHGASVTTRNMELTTGTDLLAYSLTIGTNGGTHLGSNWGNDWAVGTDTVDGTGDGTALSVTIDGDIAAAQYVTPGSYADTVTVTIWY